MRRSKFGRTVRHSIVSAAARELKIKSLSPDIHFDKSVQTIASPPIKVNSTSDERDNFLVHIIEFLKERTSENKEKVFKSAKRLIFKMVANDKKATEIVARYGKDRELLAYLFDLIEADGLAVSVRDWQMIRKAILKPDPMPKPLQTLRQSKVSGSTRSTVEKASTDGVSENRDQGSNNATTNNTARVADADNEANNNVADPEKDSSSGVFQTEGGAQPATTSTVQQSLLEIETVKKPNRLQLSSDSEDSSTGASVAADLEALAHDPSEVSEAIWAMLSETKDPPDDRDLCVFWDVTEEEKEEEKTYGKFAENLKKALKDNFELLPGDSIVASSSSESVSSKESTRSTIPEPDYEYRHKEEVAFTEFMRDEHGNKLGRVDYDTDSKVINEIIVDDVDKFSCLEYDKTGKVLLIVQFDSEGNELNRYDFLKAKASSYDTFDQGPKSAFRNRVKQLIDRQRTPPESSTRIVKRPVSTANLTTSDSDSDKSSTSDTESSSSTELSEHDLYQTKSAIDTIQQDKWVGREEKYEFSHQILTELIEDKDLQPSKTDLYPSKSNLHSSKTDLYPSKSNLPPSIFQMSEEQGDPLDVLHIVRKSSADSNLSTKSRRNSEGRASMRRESVYISIQSREDDEEDQHLSENLASTSSHEIIEEGANVKIHRISESGASIKSHRSSASSKRVSAMQSDFITGKHADSLRRSDLSVKNGKRARENLSKHHIGLDAPLISPEQKIRRSTDLAKSIPLHMLEEGHYDLSVFGREPEKPKTIELDGKEIPDEDFAQTLKWTHTEKSDVNKYLASHGIYELFQFMIADLVHVKPENPIDYLICMTRTINKNIKVQETLEKLSGDKVLVP